MTAAAQLVRPGTLLLSSPEREPALRGWLDRHSTLIEAAESHPSVVRLEGRGRVALVPGPEGWAAERWVVRHYHRGGAVAGVLGDRYLRVGTPRPFREVRLLEAVRSRGVPAPEPVGAAVHGTGPFYRGDLVTRWVPDSLDLATTLFSPAGGGASDGAAAMRSAGRLVHRLHRRGVEHRDLNLKNILLTPVAGGAGEAGGAAESGQTAGGGEAGEPTALILDLDRARLHADRVPPSRAVAMIARFWRSARKWERRTGRELPLSLRSAFDEGYAAGPVAASAG